MIRRIEGDILKVEAEALVNTVNCVGVMGRGIALQFKKAYPDNFKAYAKACDKGDVQPGRMFVFETGTITLPHYIINFPTKRHWRGKSRLEDIESGLEALGEVIKRYGIKTIAIPPLGSGLGGLKWQDVRPRIEESLEGIIGLDVLLFEPKGRPENARGNRSKKVPNMTKGRAALVGLMQRYLSGLMDPTITLVEVYKLMYFLQEAGEPLKLHYSRGPYGPYAENMRHVLNRIEGHLISGFYDGGESPNKQLQIVPGAIDDASRFLDNFPETLARLNRVGELVDGFETPFGLELLSTVHWVVEKDKVVDPDEIADHVYAWNNHKKQFSAHQLRLAFEVLSKEGWLNGASLQPDDYMFD